MTEIVIRMLQEMRAHMDTRFEQIEAHLDARFAQVDARFAQVDARFAQVDARFDVIESALLDLATQNRFIVKHLTTQAGQIRDLAGRVSRIETRLDGDEKP